MGLFNLAALALPVLAILGLRRATTRLAVMLGVALALNGSTLSGPTPNGPATDGSTGLLRAALVAVLVAGLAGVWGSTRALGCSLTGSWQIGRAHV